MYIMELIGSLLMVVHGLLLIGLLENLKNLKLIRILHSFTKCLLICYALLFVIRTATYIGVHSELAKLDTKNMDQGFGNFLASYMFDSKVVAGWVTFVLILVFMGCIGTNWIVLRLTKGLEEYVTSSE